MKKHIKKRGGAGFTLAELLIIVAIVAVLVAVCIPVFSTALRNAKEAACAANRRALESELSAVYITDNSEDSVRLAFEGHKSDKSCPFGGTYSYLISEGRITVRCSHLGSTGALANSTEMAKLKKTLEDLGLVKKGYNVNSAPSDIELIRQGLSQVGVNLDDLNAWALRFNAGDSYPKLYWTDKDIPANYNGTVYAMAYTLTSGKYTVWEMNVVNGVITNEKSGPEPVERSEQTYDNMVKKYNAHIS